MAEQTTPTLEQLSDGALLAAFAERREEAAFAELVGRHAGMVLGACRAFVGEAGAEDAAQAVFLALAQKASALRRYSTVAGWLYRVAGYVAANSRRADRIRRGHEHQAARMNPEAIDTGPASDTRLGQLHESLAKLPEKYRVALILHHLEGQTQQQTAAIIGCSLSAAAVRLNRGRQMLRDRLAKGASAISAVETSTLLANAMPAGGSDAFVSSTTRAAHHLASGQSATAISASALTLSNGALRMIFMLKIKVAALIMAALLLVFGATTATRLFAQSHPNQSVAVVQEPLKPATTRRFPDGYLITGAVKRPGEYGDQPEPMTLRQLVTIAGGPTHVANGQLWIIRTLSDNHSSEVIKFYSLGSLMKDPASLMILRKLDLVVILGTADPTTITQITLDRSASDPAAPPINCPEDSLMLRSDGTATYTGKRNARLIGTYQGKFPQDGSQNPFPRLAKLYQSALRSEAMPTSQPTPGATEIVWHVVDSGGDNDIVDSAPDPNSDLWLFETAVRGVAADIAWEKIDGK